MDQHKLFKAISPILTDESLFSMLVFKKIYLHGIIPNITLKLFFFNVYIVVDFTNVTCGGLKEKDHQY